MVNRHRGEVEAVLDGRPYAMCLTLGALAELERAFGVENLSALVERLSQGAFTSKQLLAVIGCGLRGAGHVFSDEEVAEMQCDGGAGGYAKLVGDLLEATFASQSSNAVA